MVRIVSIGFAPFHLKYLEGTSPLTSKSECFLSHSKFNDC